MPFLQRLLNLIDSSGISRNKLLTDLGINKSAIFAWENRGTIPSGEIISKLADYFHVSTDYLLGRTDDPRPVGEEEKPAALSQDAPAGQAELVSIYRSLNQEGQEKLLGYAKDLEDTGRYIKTGLDQLGKAKDA